MNKIIYISLFFILYYLGSAEDNANKSSLRPEIEPFKSDYLKVSDIHEIYYELCGNPEGKPVFVLHGGPGGRISPYYRRFFNPEKFLIVLFDQRGCGKSKPYAEIIENTTQDLIKDIEKLRKHLELEKIILFGGSWGTTLGLAYAETYPENTAGLVLRGLFLSTDEEIDYFYNGGVKTFFPEVYEKFISSLPEPNKKSLPKYLFELMQNPDTNIIKKYAKVWAAYEIKISGLNISDKEVDNILSSFNPLSFSLFENYYMSKRCFLEKEQLLKYVLKLIDIPIYIVNGRYDMICPPITAYKFQKACPWAIINITEGSGHWMGEPETEKTLIEIMRKFE
ncbi:MAG: prolyl aminopeptidase [bacterium]